MPASLASTADRVSDLLAVKGYSHLKAKARGKNITIYAESDDDPEPRLRLSALGGGHFGVAFPNFSGRWDPAPISGSLSTVIDEVANHFGWHLDAWFAP